jgi:hypothetical protein
LIGISSRPPREFSLTSAGTKRPGQVNPVELIVRRVEKGQDFREELVLRIGHEEPTDAKVIKKRLYETLRNLVEKDIGNEGLGKKRKQKRRQK